MLALQHQPRIGQRRLHRLVAGLHVHAVREQREQAAVGGQVHVAQHRLQAAQVRLVVAEAELRHVRGHVDDHVAVEIEA